MRIVKVGLGGLGTIGGGVAKLIQAHHDDFLAKYDVDIQLAAVCCREPETVTALGLNDVFVENFVDLASDPELDIVIELFGGTGAAKTLVETALKAGHRVVTANKALLAAYGKELFALANENNTEIAFEASVGGGIPIIGPLTSSLAANEITAITGIINGTTNYMLTRMAEEGLEFDDVLKQAQEQGYAEANPAADVNGDDPAAKLTILASLAFDTTISADDVKREGIANINPFDISCGLELGFALKLLAIARKTDSGLELRVHPAFVPLNHALATIGGVFNAIFVEGDFIGEVMFHGPGAGEMPTASAVCGDILRIARDLEQGTPLRPLQFGDKEIAIADIDAGRSAYYIRVNGMPDAEIAAIFNAHNVYVEEAYGLSSHGCDDEECCGEHDHSHGEPCECGHEHVHGEECDGNPEAMIYLTAPSVVSNVKAAMADISEKAEDTAAIRLEFVND